MMKTMRWSTIRLGLSGLVAVGTVLASAPGTSLLAQDVDISRDACRCVDTGGNDTSSPGPRTALSTLRWTALG